MIWVNPRQAAMGMAHAFQQGFWRGKPQRSHYVTTHWGRLRCWWCWILAALGGACDSRGIGHGLHIDPAAPPLREQEKVSFGTTIGAVAQSPRSQMTHRRAGRPEGAIGKRAVDAATAGGALFPRIEEREAQRRRIDFGGYIRESDARHHRYIGLKERRW